MVRLQPNLGINRNTYATMRRNFSCELYLCHSKVDSMLATFVVIAVASLFDGTWSDLDLFFWFSAKPPLTVEKAGRLSWEKSRLSTNGSPKEQVRKAHGFYRRLGSLMFEHSSISLSLSSLEFLPLGWLQRRVICWWTANTEVR